MSELKWHLMDDKQPEHEKNDYLVLGVRGGLYLANTYVNERWGNYFRESHGHHIDVDKVLAWAEIPPMEVDE